VAGLFLRGSFLLELSWGDGTPAELGAAPDLPGHRASSHRITGAGRNFGQRARRVHDVLGLAPDRRCARQTEEAGERTEAGGPDPPALRPACLASLLGANTRRCAGRPRRCCEDALWGLLFLGRARQGAALSRDRAGYPQLFL
ncbi:MAG: hypothetical protein AVDCRST_MAG78-3488, partial [uncultured Rubrobacteraceae bacterium]